MTENGTDNFRPSPKRHQPRKAQAWQTNETASFAAKNWECSSFAIFAVPIPCSNAARPAPGNWPRSTRPNLAAGYGRFTVIPAYCETCGKCEFYLPEIVGKVEELAFLVKTDTVESANKMPAAALQRALFALFPEKVQRYDLAVGAHTHGHAPGAGARGDAREDQR